VSLAVMSAVLRVDGSWVAVVDVAWVAPLPSTRVGSSTPL